jgi:hypothetical protein
LKLTWTSNATLRYDSPLLVRKLRAPSRNNSRGTCFQIQITGTVFVTLKSGQEDHHHHRQPARQAGRYPYMHASLQVIGEDCYYDLLGVKVDELNSVTFLIRLPILDTITGV